MEDIRLDSSWKLTQAANGDAPVVSGTECLLQDIRLESLTQEGELFYDPDYGWSLLDFLQGEDSKLKRAAIEMRVRQRLSKRTAIDPASIRTVISFLEDALRIQVLFSLQEDKTQEYGLEINLDRIRVEVE